MTDRLMTASTNWHLAEVRLYERHERNELLKRMGSRLTDAEYKAVIVGGHGYIGASLNSYLRRELDRINSESHSKVKIMRDRVEAALIELDQMVDAYGQDSDPATEVRRKMIALDAELEYLVDLQNKHPELLDDDRDEWRDALGD